MNQIQVLAIEFLLILLVFEIIGHTKGFAKGLSNNQIRSLRTRIDSSAINNRTSSRALYDDVTTQEGDQRVPFWNIAHMMNSLKEIEPALREGANGIEVDVSFDKRGVPESTFHGIPCDCGRVCSEHEDFVHFIQGVARIVAGPYSERLQLVMFDLKLKDLDYPQREVAGKMLASVLHEHLYRGLQQDTSRLKQANSLYKPAIRVIVSINHVNDSNLIDSFLNYMHQNRLKFMHQHVGFDVGMNDNLNSISTMWSSFKGATLNIWQGDGLTNCVNIARGADRLKEAITIRNAQGHFRKIYYWTVDVAWHIRAVLRFGLDAVLTNQPRRVNQVLNEPEFIIKYRLATPYDDPFAQYWIKPLAWTMPVPTLIEAVETVENIQKTSERYIQKLPDGIATALKKVGQKFVLSR